jgi:hypothetical protein
LALSPLRVLAVQDPRLDIADASEQAYAVHVGGQSVKTTVIGANSFGPAGLQFTYQPSERTVISKNLAIESTFTVTVTNTVAPGAYAIAPGSLDALRALPLHSICSNVQVSVNGTPFNTQINSYLTALQKKDASRLQKFQSGTPTYPDDFAYYSDANLTARSPFLTYSGGQAGSVPPRGAWDITIVSNAQNATGAAADRAAVVRFTVREWIMCPPFTYEPDQVGLYGVNSLDVQLVFGNIARLWSHMAGANGNPNVSVTAGDLAGANFVTNAKMIVTTIMPSPTQSVPRSTTFGWTKSQAYFSTDNNVADAASTDISTQSVNLGAVPHRCLIFAAKNQSRLTATDSDGSLKINSLQISFDNRDGILSGAVTHDLWQLSAANGIELDYNQFSGKQLVAMAAGAKVTASTIGSVILLNFGKDIPCSPGTAPGSTGSYPFQVTANVTNTTGEAQANVVLYAICFWDSIATITDGIINQQSSILTPADVVSSVQTGLVSLPAEAREGGGLFDTLKKGWEQYARPAARLAHGALSAASNAGLLGGELITKSELAQAVKMQGSGYSGGGRSGGGPSGGKLVSKKALRALLA